MAKKLGKRNKKKSLDGRDFAVFGGYIIFFLIIGFLYAQASSGNKEVKKLEKEEATIKKELKRLKAKKKELDRDKKETNINLSRSKNDLKKQEQKNSIVTGTSLDYAKKNKLLMAAWEAIDKVRNVALRKISIEENAVKLELFTQSDVFLTEFMSELHRRKDLIETIQIKETNTEKVGIKKDKEVLVGYIDIEAKKPESDYKASSDDIVAPKKSRKSVLQRSNLRERLSR